MIQDYRGPTAPHPLIAAPVTTAREAALLMQAGARELYCGLMTRRWMEQYGQADLITRRQGLASHVSSLDELSEIITIAKHYRGTVSLAANRYYSEAQERWILEEIGAFADMGGQGIILADIGLLLALKQRDNRLNFQLSSLANVFNTTSAGLFEKLGVSRIILPRDLSLREFRLLSAGMPPMDMEVIVLHQKCQFMDGLCGFYHELRFTCHTPGEFDYRHIRTVPSGDRQPVLELINPRYQGHGCDLPWRTIGHPVTPLMKDDFNHPHCAACQLASFIAMGITHFKIAGRGYPTQLLVKSVQFIRAALDLIGGNGLQEAVETQRVKQRYRAVWGTACSPADCYYRSEGMQRGHPPDRAREQGTETQTARGLTPGPLNRPAKMVIANATLPIPPGVNGALWLDWRTPVPARIPDRYSRLYFGHETCPSIIPGMIPARDLIQAASDQGKRSTLVTPFLSPERFAHWLTLIDGLLTVDPELEIVCSDWGLVHYLTEHQWGRPVLGRMLAFQTTDPRLSELFTMPGANDAPAEAWHVDGTMCHKVTRPLPAALRTHYRSLWQTKPLVQAFFEKRGIHRCELNLPPAGVEWHDMPSWSVSVHVSDVLLSVMRQCPGSHENFNRPATGCPGHCQQSGKVDWHLTEDGIHIFRRYNGLYYHPARPDWIGAAIDRYVFRPA